MTIFFGMQRGLEYFERAQDKLCAENGDNVRPRYIVGPAGSRQTAPAPDCLFLSDAIIAFQHTSSYETIKPRKMAIA